MRHILKSGAMAAALIGAASFTATAAPRPDVKLMAAGDSPSLTQEISFRRAHWRRVSPCHRNGRFYTYGGGWGCDYYLYGLWPARPPRRW